MKTIAHITDIHLDEDFPREHGVESTENWKRIMEDVTIRNITDIVFGGDIGSPESNAWFFESVQQNNLRLHISLGNHDQFSQVRKYYQPEGLSGTNELYYGFEDTYYRTLFLDSSAECVSDKQFHWLQQQLHTNKKILLFIHHPVLAVDTAADRKYPLEGRERIHQVLQQHSGEVIVFCGHYHMADQKTAGNITQYITPASSFQMERHPEEIVINAQTFGYRVIRFAEDKIDTELVSFQRSNKWIMES